MKIAFWYRHFEMSEQKGQKSNVFLFYLLIVASIVIYIFVELLMIFVTLCKIDKAFEKRTKKLRKIPS